jgi:hypothetical protein
VGPVRVPALRDRHAAGGSTMRRTSHIRSFHATGCLLLVVGVLNPLR